MKKDTSLTIWFRKIKLNWKLVGDKHFLIKFFPLSPEVELNVLCSVLEQS